MKKSVILIIGIIYIVSVVIVGFIGLQMRVYNPNIYVTDIICTVTNFEPKIVDDKYMQEWGCQYYYVINVPDTADDITIEIKCRVIPEDATNALVDFYIDQKDANYVSINDSSNNIASITFKDDDFMGGSYNIKVKSTDGTNVEKVIRFRVKY